MRQISMRWFNLYYVSSELGQEQASNRSYAQAGDVQNPYARQRTAAALH
jgi:hypothetical protein